MFIGLVLIVLSFILGWPLIAALGVLAVWIKEPLLAIIGGPAAYAFSCGSFLSVHGFQTHLTIWGFWRDMPYKFSSENSFPNTGSKSKRYFCWRCCRLLPYSRNPGNDQVKIVCSEYNAESESRIIQRKSAQNNERTCACGNAVHGRFKTSCGKDNMIIYAGRLSSSSCSIRWRSILPVVVLGMEETILIRRGTA